MLADIISPLMFLSGTFAYLSHSKTKRSKWKNVPGYMPSNIPRDKNIFINNLYISSDLQNWSHDAQSNIKEPNDLQLKSKRMEWHPT